MNYKIFTQKTEELLNKMDKEKLVKSRKKSALELIESMDRAEDIYKIDKRVPGSAYSGKRQK